MPSWRKLVNPFRLAEERKASELMRLQGKAGKVMLQDKSNRTAGRIELGLRSMHKVIDTGSDWLGALYLAPRQNPFDLMKNA